MDERRRGDVTARRRAERSIRVGVISDTHGLLRPEAKHALAGCGRLIHAGDVGKPEVLDELREIAPVTAIRGNVDKWAADLPDTEVVEIAGHCLYVLHDLNALDLDPAAAGFAAVISGHSHRPRVERRDGVLYLNPGSAGPRRFKLPVAVALLEIGPRGLEARVVELEIGSSRPSASL
ncbi:MAG TPA: metallophosphoesterase family protein [Gammaproteobacteria bacterium]|nr:metallophosphoesterase family protein [Gammaproteobacteria bacterium]